VGSDGLFKYAPIRRVCDAARAGPPAEAARALVGLVRLPRGGLQDDVAVVVCAPAHPTTTPG
jgi:hypothetical protein